MHRNALAATYDDNDPPAEADNRMVEVTGWVPARIIIDMGGLTISNGCPPAPPAPCQQSTGKTGKAEGSCDRQGGRVPVIVPDSPPVTVRQTHQPRQTSRCHLPTHVPSSISVRSSKKHKRDVQTLSYADPVDSSKSTSSWVEDQLNTPPPPPPPPPPSDFFGTDDGSQPALSITSRRSRPRARRTESVAPLGATSRAVSPTISPTLRSSSIGFSPDSSSPHNEDPYGYVSESDNGRVAKNAWYVVTKGKQTGLFKRWTNVLHATNGVSGAAQKGCKHKEAARELYQLALREGKVEKIVG